MNIFMLSILVVNYNTSKLTLKAIDSVFKEQSRFPFDIFVLDNASSDDSVQALKKIFGERIHLIPSEVNLGFAVGNNQAAKLAKGEYLLLLNPDTVVFDHAIDKLVAFAQMNPEGGIWGGRTLFKDGTHNPSSFWKKQSVWSLFCQALGLSSLFRGSRVLNPERMGGRDFRGSKKVDIISGCFFLIKRELWQQLEGFDPAFFMYGEEADLCLRAKKIGAQPMVTSEATIIHYGGASEKVRADKLVRLIKAKMLLIKKHFAPGSIFFGIMLLAGWPLSRYLVHTVAAAWGRSASAESRLVWGEVWRRRNEWLAE